MVRFTVAISEELNNWLTEHARLNSRSKNKHLEYLIKLAKQLQEKKANE
jgi:hypothetical protein